MWMLQPHNYSQAVLPNLYNVAYRRQPAYKGMGHGGFGQDSSVPITFFGQNAGGGTTDIFQPQGPQLPGSVLPSPEAIITPAGGGTPSVTSLNIPAIYGAPAPTNGTAPPTTTGLFSGTTGLILIGASVLVLLLIMRRR